MTRSKLVLLGIIFLGLFLRLFILSQRGSFWFDEAFSVHFASMDLREIWSFLKFENNPPLYFYILHFWISIFGNSELAVRSLSMIFGVASIPMVYLVGVKLFTSSPPPQSSPIKGEETAKNPSPLMGGARGGWPVKGQSQTAALFAAFLTAISTFQVFYATETRMYSLYLFFTLLAIHIYITLERRRKNNQPTRLWRVFFFLTLSVLIWTHITAWWFVLVFGVYILWKEKFNFKRFYSTHRGFLIIVGLLVVQFLPWAWNFIRFKIAAPLSQGYFFHLPPDRNYFLDILETFLVFGEDSAFVVTLLSAVVGALLWYALKDIRRQGLPDRGRGGLALSYAFLLLWLLVPLFVGFAFSNAVPRYFIAVAPALYLLMGIGFARLVKHEERDMRHDLADTKNKFMSRISYLIPLILFVLILPGYVSLTKIAHHQWDRLAEWIMSYEVGSTKQDSCLMPHTPCLIIINPHSEILPFERYYKGALPVVGFYPRADSDSRELRIVKTNWVSINTKENVRTLADVTEGYNRVFLVTGEIDYTIGRNLVPLWFWENGWQKVSAQEFGRIGVMELQRMSLRP